MDFVTRISFSASHTKRVNFGTIVSFVSYSLTINCRISGYSWRMISAKTYGLINNMSWFRVGGLCLWIQLGHHFHQTSVAVLHFGSGFACGPSLQILVVRPWLILFIHGNDSNTSNFSTVCLRCLSVMQSNSCLNSSAVPNTGTSLFGRIRIVAKQEASCISVGAASM